MKVAIVHDYIKEYGGAERVLETLHEMFPNAPIFTTVYLPEYLGPHKDRFMKWDIRPSFLQRIPFVGKLISPARLITPFIFRSMRFDDYDVVIVSATGAYSSNLITKGKALHICYCHTPPRYLYGYPTARNVTSFVKPLVHVMNHIFRVLDFESSQNVDFFIANSKETASRIQKFYRREATVIYPPVDIPTLKVLRNKSKDGYYLAGGRLARAKRIDLAIKACTELGFPLKVFGKSFAGYGVELQKIAGPTVEFVGEISEKEKYELMANAKAYIFPSEFEDFGITPVEAMGVGTPVIALRSGGVRETVLDGLTGVFFDKPTIAALKESLIRFEKIHIKPIDCIKQAKKFDVNRFKKDIYTFFKRFPGNKSEYK